MTPTPNSAPPAEPDFLQFVQQTVAEEIAKQNAGPGVPPVVAPPVPSPIPINLNGQTFTFNSPEEVSAAIQNLSKSYSDQIAQLQATQTPVGRGAEVTGKEETPAFDINTFVSKMTTNPVDAFDYVDEARYGIKNPSQAIKDAIKSREEVDNIKRVLAVYQFKDNHPEFPASPQSANMIYQIMAQNNLPFDVSGLESAYGLAVMKGFFPHPMQVQQQQQQQEQQQSPYQEQFQFQPQMNFQGSPGFQGGVNPTVFNGGFLQAPPRVSRTAQDPIPDLASIADNLTTDQIEAIFRRVNP